MELRDLIVTPIVLLVIFVVAYLIRPFVTDDRNRLYFLPALGVKVAGAIALGIVYQFYYGTGDTFVYHNLGSRIIWNAFVESPATGVKLLFADNSNPGDIYRYASQIYFFRDPNSYMVVRIAFLLDLLTFSTYSATAALFAVISFIGSWQFYLTFYKQYPHLHGQLAIAAFFIPSVFFWGSGILKDSITLACLGIATYQIYTLFFEREIKLSSILLLLISLYLVFSIKKFILQAYLPMVILWLGASQIHQLRSVILRVMLVPFVAISLLVSGLFTVVKIGEDDDRYDVSKLANTARITAYDIRYWSGRFAGSGYSLGDLDGTVESMVRLAPQAINVSLYRPYLWEVHNPLMFMSALESLAFLIFSLVVLWRSKRYLFALMVDYNVLFCLAFSIVLAFAVGIATFNFGTLIRYKIPLLPFFSVALVLMQDGSRRREQTPGYLSDPLISAAHKE